MRADAARWSVPPLGAWLVFGILGVLVAAAAIATLHDWNFLRPLTDEDHVLEWLQTLGYMTGAIFAGLTALLLARSGERGWAILYGLLAFGLFFVAGEEVAWGQRLLGFGTPGPIDRVNSQGSTTLHNIGGFQGVFDHLQTFAGIYGIGAALLAQRLPARVPERVAELAFPPLFLIPLFLDTVIWGIGRIIFDLSEVTSQYVNEWIEFALAVSLGAFALLSWRRQRRSAHR